MIRKAYRTDESRLSRQHKAVAAAPSPARSGTWLSLCAISIAVLASLASPQRARAGAHDAPSAAPAHPAKAAAPEVPSMDALRQRLADKVAAVRAAQPAAARPVAAHGQPEAAAHGAAAAEGGHAAAPRRAAPRHGAPAHRSDSHGAAAPDPVKLAAVHRGSAPADSHAGHGAAHWAYSGEGGPAAWAQMKPEFATCGIGSRQSPIDIRGGIKVELDPIKFDYRPAGFNVIDNGHTVQVNIGGGNAIEVGNRRFDLVQFHFHRPSEERINGRQFEMVAHLVHKDAEGRLAVVAVLMEAGKAHPVVQQVWNNLPLEKNLEQTAASAMDLSQLLPEDRRYYTYMGSLTTPPCSEGVLWLVLKQPAALTQEQIGVFSRLYANNARPIQSVGGRLIKESN